MNTKGCPRKRVTGMEQKYRPVIKIQIHYVFTAVLRYIIIPIICSFRNKKREYLKEKFNELETNSRKRHIRDFYRGMNEFKKVYQPRTNLVKDENGNLLADSDSILGRWKKFIYHLLNVNYINNVTWREMHTTEPFRPEIYFLLMLKLLFKAENVQITIY